MTGNLTMTTHFTAFFKNSWGEPVPETVKDDTPRPVLLLTSTVTLINRIDLLQFFMSLLCNYIFFKCLSTTFFRLSLVYI